MNVGLSSIKILSSTTETQLNDFRDSMNIDFNAFKTEVSTKTFQCCWWLSWPIQNDKKNLNK